MSNPGGRFAATASSVMATRDHKLAASKNGCVALKIEHNDTKLECKKMNIKLVRNPNWSKANQSVAFFKHAAEELHTELQRTSAAEENG